MKKKTELDQETGQQKILREQQGTPNMTKQEMSCHRCITSSKLPTTKPEKNLIFTMQTKNIHPYKT